MSDLVAQLGGLAGTVAAFLLALAIIVGVHEYGHYIVARWSGIRSEVFSLGFGPRLWSRRDRRGTEWQIAAIPLGGYVKFLGDDNAASAGPGQPVDPAIARQTLHGAPLWARAATVAAGPVFNFLLAIAVFAAVIGMQGVATERPVIGGLAPLPPGLESGLAAGDEIVAVGGQPVADWGALVALAPTLPAAPVQDWTVRRAGAEITVPGPDVAPARIGGVAPRSPASAAGLRPDDVILSVDGVAVTRFDDLRSRVAAAQGRPLVLRIWREGSGEADVTLAPREQDLPTATGYEKRWLIGVTGDAGFIRPATRAPGLLEALRLGAGQTWGIIASSLSGIWAVIAGQIGGCNVSGAISIAEVAGEAAATGTLSFLWLIGVLSAGIGLLNLLPIPVLDGGHLAFYAYEAVAGRPPPERALRLLTTLGMALVLTLMVFGLTNDIRCR